MITAVVFKMKASFVCGGGVTVLDLIFLRFPDLELFADFEPVKKEPV